MYYASDSDGVLVMEDLRESGFSVRPAAACMDLEHCAAALRRLARMHAFGRHLGRVQ